MFGFRRWSSFTVAARQQKELQRLKPNMVERLFKFALSAAPAPNFFQKFVSNSTGGNLAAPTVRMRRSVKMTRTMLLTRVALLTATLAGILCGLPQATL